MTLPRLSRADRREQILADVLDVVLERGVAVTSKELAAAAGVAEGTLFKVFETKENLLRALVAEHAASSDAVAEWLASIDPEQLTLADLVLGMIRSAIEQYRQAFQFFYALGPYMEQPQQAEIDRFERELEPWADALRCHADELRFSPEAAAAILRMHAVAASDVNSLWGQPLSPAEHADVFLHGMAVHRSDLGDPA